MPVLLLLGDTIYQSRNDIPCTRQLLDTYEQYGKPMVAVHPVPVEDVSSYGIFSGIWEDNDERVMNLTAIAEKPTPEYASEYLTVAGRKNSNACYAAFGAYIIDQSIYNRLQYATDNNITNKKGEVELTDALEFVRDSEGMYAFVPDGESYDIGNAKAYRKAVADFGR